MAARSARTVSREIGKRAKNGHGGARAGAGRKRGALDPELLEKLGPAPLGQPLKLARWYTDVIAALTDQALRGKNVRKLLEMARGSAAAAARVLPLDIIYEAGKRLDRDDKDMREADAGGAVVARKDDDVAQRSRAVRRDPS